MHDLTKGSVVVTGGAGFIGSALVWALNQRGIDDIYVVDYLGSDDKFKNLVPLRFKDFIDAELFQKAISSDPQRSPSNIRTVFHLGACSSTTEKECNYLLNNNYLYTMSMAHWSLSIGARFVYASSAATYGDGAKGMDDKNDDLYRLRPMNMYGYSKHLFDLHAQKTGIIDAIVGLKYFNVYGPNEGHKGNMRSVVHKAFQQIKEDDVIKLFKSYKPLYKDGEQMRDFLYVKDAVDMTIHLAENKNANGLFNLGSGKAHTWIELANSIFKALDKPANIKFIDMPDNLKDKYQYYTCADITKLREAGYAKPVNSLEDAVADYVLNYLATEKFLGDEVVQSDLIEIG